MIAYKNSTRMMIIIITKSMRKGEIFIQSDTFSGTENLNICCKNVDIYLLYHLYIIIIIIIFIIIYIYTHNKSLF